MCVCRHVRNTIRRFNDEINVQLYSTCRRYSKCTCAFAYIYMYVYIYIRARAHTHTHTRTHTQASATSSWARMYVTPTSFWCSRLRRRSVPMHTCRYLYVLLLSIYPSIYTQTHTHFAAGLYQCQYICTYAYIHTYIDHIDR